MNTATKKRIRVNRSKCVKIARDVLAQLRLKRLIATNRDYCTVNNLDEVAINDPDNLAYVGDMSFQKVFQENKGITCNVCALGGLFVSLVHLENQENVGAVDATQFNVIVDRLGNIFHPRDLYLAEYIFERGECGGLDDRIDEEGCVFTDDGLKLLFSEDELKQAAAYGRKYKDNNARMRIIMLNIIRNNGRLVVPQRIRG